MTLDNSLISSPVFEVADVADVFELSLTCLINEPAGVGVGVVSSGRGGKVIAEYLS